MKFALKWSPENGLMSFTLVESVEKMDSRLYRHVFGDLPKKSTVSHTCIPCYNLVAPSIFKGLSKSFSPGDETETVFSSNIFPSFRLFGYETDFSTVFYTGSGVVDRASKLVTDKLLWEKKLTTYTPKDYNKAINSLKLVKKDEIPELSPALERYLKHFGNDPEPDFKGDYNWLYTGGNIAGFVSSSSYYLIAANEMKNSMVLNLTKLNHDGKELSADGEQRVFCLGENDPVFQISCSNEMDNFLFLTRQRQRITLLKMDDGLEHNYWTYKIDRGIFICSDLCSQSRVVATLDGFLEINLFDVEKGEKTVSHKAQAKSSSWGQVMFNHNGNSLYFADQHSLSVIDLRAATDATLLYKPASLARDCEVICNVIERKYVDNTLLIATSHNLFDIDIRNKKTNQRWTHLMTSPPQFGKTSWRNGEEVVVLQSENPEELVGIINESKNSDFEFVSSSNPRVLSKIRQEWNKAQLNGICTHPGIRERLEFAVTGLEILDISTGSKDGPHIFTMNGGGDIMVNKLIKNVDDRRVGEYRDISEISVKGLKGFEDHCLETYSGEMTADEIFDMSLLVKVLEEENLEEKNFENRKACLPQAEMFSSESLGYYKDFMAERILEIWNVKMRNFWDVDEKDEEDENVNDQLRVSKVVRWMETNEEQ